MDVYHGDSVDYADFDKRIRYDYIKNNDIAVCPLCGKYITDVIEKRGSVISIKCPRCKKVVEITL